MYIYNGSIILNYTSKAVYTLCNYITRISDASIAPIKFENSLRNIILLSVLRIGICESAFSACFFDHIRCAYFFNNQNPRLQNAKLYKFYVKYFLTFIFFTARFVLSYAYFVICKKTNCTLVSP